MRLRASETFPEHYERLPLRPTLRASAWITAAALVAAAVALALVRERTTLVSLLGGGLGIVAAVAVIAAHRLGAYEVTVTRVALTVGFPPFVLSVPVWSVRSSGVRVATGWRRAYARSELRIEIDGPNAGRSVAIPTTTGETIAALLATSRETRRG